MHKEIVCTHHEAEMSACSHYADIAAVKCKRGRPPGLKNKLKHPPATSTPYAALQTHVLQIPVGGDIAESIAAFARGCPALGVCVLSSSGRIATAVLRKASPYPSTLTVRGSFDLLSMTATFLPGGSIRSLAVTLAGPKGQVLGGVVAGQLVAAGIVVVVAATFASPAFHRMDKIGITRKSMLPVVENKERVMLHKCLAEVERDLGLLEAPMIIGPDEKKEVNENKLEHILKDFEQCIAMPTTINSGSRGGDFRAEMDLDGGCVIGGSEMFKQYSDGSTIIDCAFGSGHHDFGGYVAFDAFGSFNALC